MMTDTKLDGLKKTIEKEPLPHSAYNVDVARPF